MTERSEEKTDFERLQDLQQALGTIGHKLVIGQGAGGGEPIASLDELMCDLKCEIRKAAEADAKREATQALKDAKELQKPPEERVEGLEKPSEEQGKTPEESQKPDLTQLLEELVRSVPRHPEGEDGGSGEKKPDCCCTAAMAMAVAVAIAVGGEDKDCCCCCDDGGDSAGVDAKLPDALCVYVRGDTAIWGWNRYAREWRVHEFGESIIAVETDSKAFLTISENSAIIFDCVLGEFLTPLSAPETLKEGKII